MPQGIHHYSFAKNTRLPPRGSWILRSKRLKEIALVKTLHKFYLYALSLSRLRRQLPLGGSLRTPRAHCVHFQLSIFNFQLVGGSKPTALQHQNGKTRATDQFCIPNSAFCILHFAFRIPHSAFCILHSAFCVFFLPFFSFFRNFFTLVNKSLDIIRAREV